MKNTKREKIKRIIENTFQVSLKRCRFITEEKNHTAFKFPVKTKKQRQEIIQGFERIGKEFGCAFRIFHTAETEVIFNFEKIEEDTGEDRRIRVSIDLEKSTVTLLRKIAKNHNHNTLKPFVEQQLTRIATKGPIK